MLLMAIFLAVVAVAVESLGVALGLLTALAATFLLHEGGDNLFSHLRKLLLHRAVLFSLEGANVHGAGLGVHLGSLLRSFVITEKESYVVELLLVRLQGRILIDPRLDVVWDQFEEP